jgi:hypothetical protein
LFVAISSIAEQKEIKEMRVLPDSFVIEIELCVMQLVLSSFTHTEVQEH